jgi:CubicO group peptidase (beta-lactamase class C family)
VAEATREAPGEAPGFASAADSDPVLLGWMQGAPPPADKLVRVADGSHLSFPRTRWSYAHMGQLLPSTRVWRGREGASTLPRAPADRGADIDALRFTPLGATAPMTWAQSLDANYTDAICILHRGNIIYERYRGVMAPEQPHIAMSVTKSYVGTLAAMLVHEGVLRAAEPVTALLPEMAATAYAGATLRDVMDMRIGVRYSENYADRSAEIWQYVLAGGMVAAPTGYAGPMGYRAFLQTLKPEGAHGQSFFYKTVSTDVLAWAMQRATGLRLSQLLAQRLWQPLGCEEDAMLLVDSLGTEFAGGGLNATLRDLARFGECLRCEGHFNGRSIVPAAVVHDIVRAGAGDDLRQAFRAAGPPTLPGASYRNMWWVHNNAHGAYSARGVHGQAIYVDPTAEMVIARLGSHPLAANVHFDPTSLPAYQAVADFLLRG